MKQLRIRRAGNLVKLLSITRNGRVERLFTANLEAVASLKALAAAAATFAAEEILVETFSVPHPNAMGEIYAALIEAYRPDLYTASGFTLE